MSQVCDAAEDDVRAAVAHLDVASAANILEETSLLPVLPELRVCSGRWMVGECMVFRQYHPTCSRKTGTSLGCVCFRAKSLKEHDHGRGGRDNISRWWWVHLSASGCSDAGMVAAVVGGSVVPRNVVEILLNISIIYIEYQAQLFMREDNLLIR